MRRDDSSPRAYLESIPQDLAETFHLVRDVIRREHADIEEGIRYGMLDYPGLANLAAQKSYVSLYLLPDVLAEFRARFPAARSGKSCLRFRKPSDIDPDALAELLRSVRRERAKRASEET